MTRWAAAFCLVECFMLLAPRDAAADAAGNAVGTARPGTRIVLHDYSQLPADVLARAKVEVATIYARIGVDVVWTAPDGSEDDAHCLTVVILSREMGLKMIATDRVDDNVMGEALKAVSRAYIFAHRVRATSADRLIDFQKLLGKVIAHEIGHLLLIEHSESGIMQAGIQVQTGQSEWFTPTQGAIIRATLAGR